MFTEKHLSEPLFQKSCRPQACNFIKKETLAQLFFCEFCEISKNNLFTKYFWTTALYINDAVVMAHSHKSLKSSNIMAMFRKDKSMDKDVLFNYWFILFKERPTFLNRWATFVVKGFWNGWYMIYIVNVYGQVCEKVIVWIS